MMDTTLRKRPKDKPREIKPLDPVETKLGLKMLALNERQRNFIIAMFTVRPGHGAATKAARLSGWGNAGSSPASMATIASRLMHSDPIIEGMREYGEQFLKGTAPAALRALEKLILTPSHKGHERAVSAVVDRLYAVETTHLVKVQHDVTPDFRETAQIHARIAELTAKFRLQLPAPAARVLDGEFSEVKSQATE
jgi:hypothetical protein